MTLPPSTGTNRPTSPSPFPPRGEISNLSLADRETALPILKESFVGIYRWHAKRTLKSIETVRALRVDEQLAGVSLLELLVPEVGYVYYIMVGASFRRRGWGARLLDDALDQFRARKASIVYAAAEEDNTASLGLFASRGFREIGRKEEPSYKEGGLGAWGLRSKMMIVHGEVLLGRRL